MFNHLLLWLMMGTKLTKSLSFHPKIDEKIIVVNMMIVHILRMYNSKHLHTWDESLPYVQHIYNKSLHNSISHIRFGVCFGFQQLSPTLTLKLSLIKHPNLLSGSNTSNKKFMIFCQNPMLSTCNAMIGIGFHISFKLVTGSSYIYRKITS